MDEERDFVTFTDDDGNEFELDVVKYFFYKDNEYAILADFSGSEEPKDEEEETELYIMRIEVSEDGETEEFVSPDEEDMDELIAIAEKELMDGECGCDDCGDDCDCGCEHDHDHDHCGCGCDDK